MKDFENLKADFRDWLTLPLTKTFIDITSKEYQRHISYANTATFESYYKKELSEQATLAYGKADGIATIMKLMEICKDEEPETKNIDGKEVITYPTIDVLFKQTFEIEND